MIKRQILKAATEKRHGTYRETKISMTKNSFQKIMQTRRPWNNIFEGLEENKIVNLDIYIQCKIFQKLRQSKYFSRIQKMKKLITIRPAV